MTARNYGLSRRQAAIGGGYSQPAGALAQDNARDLKSSHRELVALSFGILSAFAPVVIVGILVFVYYALIA